MECKVVLCLCIFIAIVRATEVTLGSEWKPDLGWVITCAWKLYSNDSLQSVRLYDNDRQFMIYRPEIDGGQRSGIFQRPEDTMQVVCTQSVPRGLVGTCVLTKELYQPPTSDFSYGCEASGERPMFRMQKGNIVVNAFVPPTDAVMEVESIRNESTRMMLNCTTSGLPAPHIKWNVAETQVPEDFQGTYWNVTSKLWHTWSSLSYTPNAATPAVCTPETRKDGKTSKGKEAMYNSAVGNKGFYNTIFLIPTITLLLLR